MRINAEQLTRTLTNKLHPIYFIFGEEPFLLQKSYDTLIYYLKQKGFNEKIKFDASNNCFKWEQVFFELNSLSLFSGFKIIDIYLSGSNLGNIAKNIENLLSNISKNCVVLLRANQVTFQSQKAKWFLNLDKTAVIIQHRVIPNQQLPTWCTKYAKEKGLTIEPQLAQYLAQNSEGNLLALTQEIEKLQLRFGKTITLENVIGTTSNNARYEVFDLINTALLGNTKKVPKIYHNLIKGNLESSLPLCIWALTKALRDIINVHTHVKNGISIAQACKRANIWQKDIAGISKAIIRCSHKKALQLLAKCAKIDYALKSGEKSTGLQDFYNIILILSGIKL